MLCIYSPEYEKPDLQGHIFPLSKYRLIKEKLIKTGQAVEGDFVAPDKASQDDILLAHTRDYLDKLVEGKLSVSEILKLELPYSKELVESFIYCAGGTIKACETAIYHNVGFHIGGGFHHAFADHGEGFCVLNDAAVAARKLLKEGRAKKVLIADCDLHQGNGTANIFMNEPNVFTYSMHQANIYPYPKEESSMDVELVPGTDDEMYNNLLDKNMKKIIRDFGPDFVFYIAGADPYRGDQLSGLDLSMEGLRKRDRILFDHVRKAKLPVVVVLAGGYSVKIEDTVDIHCNTCAEAQRYYC